MSEARGLGWPICLFYNIFECPKVTAYCAASPDDSEASPPFLIGKMSQSKKLVPIIVFHYRDWMGVWSATIGKNSENKNFSAPLRWSEVDKLTNVTSGAAGLIATPGIKGSAKQDDPLQSRRHFPPITGVECSFSLLPTSIVNVRPNLQMMPLLITLIFPRAQQTSPVYAFSTGIFFFSLLFIFFFLFNFIAL